MPFDNPFRRDGVGTIVDARDQEVRIHLNTRDERKIAFVLDALNEKVRRDEGQK